MNLIIKCPQCNNKIDINEIVDKAAELKELENIYYDCCIKIEKYTREYKKNEHIIVNLNNDEHKARSIEINDKIVLTEKQLEKFHIEKEKVIKNITDENKRECEELIKSYTEEIETLLMEIKHLNKVKNAEEKKYHDLKCLTSTNEFLNHEISELKNTINETQIKIEKLKSEVMGILVC